MIYHNKYVFALIGALCIVALVASATFSLRTARINHAIQQFHNDVGQATTKDQTQQAINTFLQRIHANSLSVSHSKADTPQSGNVTITAPGDHDSIQAGKDYVIRWQSTGSVQGKTAIILEHITTVSTSESDNIESEEIPEFTDQESSGIGIACLADQCPDQPDQIQSNEKIRKLYINRRNQQAQTQNRLQNSNNGQTSTQQKIQETVIANNEVTAVGSQMKYLWNVPQNLIAGDTYQIRIDIEKLDRSAIIRTRSHTFKIVTVNLQACSGSVKNCRNNFSDTLSNAISPSATLSLAYAASDTPQQCTGKAFVNSKTTPGLLEETPIPLWNRPLTKQGITVIAPATLTESTRFDFICQYGAQSSGNDNVIVNVQSKPTIAPTPLPSPTPPAIKVIYPNGGEVWQGNSTQTIAWQADNYQKVRIRILCDADSTILADLKDIPSGYTGGTYSLRLPPLPQGSGDQQCKVQVLKNISGTVVVANLKQNEEIDSSDQSFIITGNKPDLVIDKVKLNLLSVGQPLSGTVTIKNIGKGTARSSKAFSILQISDSKILSGLPNTSFSLQPGATQSFTFLTPANITSPGRQTISVRVDPDNKISESNENNNLQLVAFSPSTNGNKPHLDVLMPTSGAVGSQFIIKGSGFGEHDNTVHFGSGVLIHEDAQNNGTQITVRVPAYLSPPCAYVHPPCEIASNPVRALSYPVSVTTQNGLDSDNTLQFRVTSADSP